MEDEEYCHVSLGLQEVNILTKPLAEGRFKMRKEHLVFGREHFPP